MLIHSVKLLIEKHPLIGVIAKNQKLICKGKVLDDRSLVKDTKLGPGVKVTCIGKK
jgi:hypothetical protein